MSRKTDRLSRASTGSSTGREQGRENAAVKCRKASKIKRLWLDWGRPAQTFARLGGGADRSVPSLTYP
jgi:hypothetical protein